MQPRFIFLFSLIAVGIAQSLQTNELENLVENAVNFTEKNFPAESDKALTLYRQKRGWGAILFTGVSILTKVTSLGLTLGSALSEGCSDYPSICNDRDEIERLDKLIIQNTQKYETEYFQAKKSYLDLKIATLNNKYISYYINETMQAVESIEGIEEKLSLMLQIKLPKIDAASKTTTFIRHLEQAVGKLEYRLSDLQQMLREHKHNALIGIVIQFAVEATLNRFVKAFHKAYIQVRNEANILETTNSLLWERIEGVDVAKPKSRTFVDKLKLVPKAFKQFKETVKLVPKTIKQMGKNFKQGFVNVKKSVSKWGRIRNWKGFKGKLIHTLKSPLARLQRVKEFFSPKTNAKFVKDYKITWSQGIMTAIGIIGDVIFQVIGAKQWEKAAEQMRKARVQYQEHNSKLNAELNEIIIEQKKMDETWIDEIEIFSNISLAYKSLVIDSSKNINFSDVIGLSKLPLNLSNSLFSVDFNNISKESLGSSQTAILDFLKEVDYNFTVIEDEFRAREILYNNTLKKSEQEEPVHEILSDISSILEFSHSRTIRRFGSQVKERDLVCTISILRNDITEYDFFPLEPFRPRCEVNSSIFDVLASRATSKRKSKLMQEIVLNSVKTGKEDALSELLDSVHSAYLGVTDKTLADFGNSITEQDIICMISEKFPSKDTYGFIDLNPFRPNCSSVNPDHFKALLQDASKQRQLANGIKTDLESCQAFKFCPCLKGLAETKYQSTEADLLRAIKQLSPSWQQNREAQFCGPSCNSCVHL